MKRGDILPDDAGHDDGWMVVRVSKCEVEVLDLVYRSVWRWNTYAGDGIRVDQAMPMILNTAETTWTARAINAFPPPEAVAYYLRGLAGRKCAACGELVNP